jgi:hypothetical protein
VTELVAAVVLVIVSTPLLAKVVKLPLAAVDDPIAILFIDPVAVGEIV